MTGARRIVRFGLEFVRTHARRKVTLGHKANIMRFSDGLFLSIGQIEAEGHPEVWFEDMEIDHLSMRLVREPSTFDVLLLPNLYGDIISDLCAGLVGGSASRPARTSGGSTRCSNRSTAAPPTSRARASRTRSR